MFDLSRHITFVSIMNIPNFEMNIINHFIIISLNSTISLIMVLLT